MVMNIIYKKTADLDEENNFSIDLISNNEIEEMFFKGKDVVNIWVRTSNQVF